MNFSCICWIASFDKSKIGKWNFNLCMFGNKISLLLHFQMNSSFDWILVQWCEQIFWHLIYSFWVSVGRYTDRHTESVEIAIRQTYFFISCCWPEKSCVFCEPVNRSEVSLNSDQTPNYRKLLEFLGGDDQTEPEQKSKKLLSFFWIPWQLGKFSFASSAQANGERRRPEQDISAASEQKTNGKKSFQSTVEPQNFMSLLFFFLFEKKHIWNGRGDELKQSFENKDRPYFVAQREYWKMLNKKNLTNFKD